MIEDEKEEETPKLVGKRRPPMITRNANGRMTPKVSMLQSTKLLPSSVFDGQLTSNTPLEVKKQQSTMTKEMNYDNLVYGESGERRISTQ